MAKTTLEYIERHRRKLMKFGGGENMSKKYSLNKQDLLKIATTVIIYLVGAGLVFLAEQLKLVDFGKFDSFATIGILALSYIGKLFVQGK